jgi:intergrase/recombinase
VAGVSLASDRSYEADRHVGHGLARAAHRSGPSRARFHDLRHFIITELAELGMPDHVLESIS